MANPYFPSYPYPTPYNPQINNGQFPTSSQIGQNGLIVAWVQGGEQSMKSFPLGPNQKAFLFSTDENIFGIKTTDSNAMPYPLEVFKYDRISSDIKQTQSVQVPTIDTSEFVTKDEFEARMTSLSKEFYAMKDRPPRNNQNGGEQKHGK